MQFFDFPKSNIFLLIILFAWVLAWKGYALWMASKHNQKRWFIAILILNTFSILEIIYIFYVIKKKPNDIINDIKNKI